MTPVCHHRNRRLSRWVPARGPRIITLAVGFVLAFGTVLAAADNDSGSPSRRISVLEYLKNISGQRIVAGIHNREPNRQPAQQTDRMQRLVGRFPGLWSGDFLFSESDVQNRWTMIRECRHQ